MGYVVRHQVINNPEGKVKFWVSPSGGREHYHIGIWVDGPANELDEIERVEYLLHPSFNQPRRRSANRENKFGITIWTWGMFQIEVTVFERNGAEVTLSYYLTYELPADDGTTYVRVQDEE